MGGDKGRILLIDDEPEIVAIHARTLAADGYAVEQAVDGASALKVLEGGNFELVISDINMPGTDGLALLRWAQEHKPGLKVILMTGFSGEHSPQEAIDLGCFGFLAKPVSKTELLQVVKNALSSDPADKITEKDYARISLDTFLSGSKADFSIYVKMTNTRFLKIAHTGDDIDLPRMQELCSRGVKELWIEVKDLGKYMQLTQTFAKLGTTKKDWSSEKRSQLLLGACDVAAEALRLSGINEATIESAKSTLMMTIDFFAESKGSNEVLALFSHASQTSYASASTISCLCGLIAKVMGWTSARTITSFTLAGFLHDIGLYRLPPELQNKPLEAMEPSELEEFKKHPLEAVELLKGIPNFPPETLTAIAQHHENATPQAFPKGLSRSAILPMAKILALVDTYVDTVMALPPDQKANATQLIGVAKNLRPRPLDEVALDALIFLIQYGDVAQAAEKFKLRSTSRSS